MKAIAILAGLALAALGSGAAAKPVPDKSLSQEGSFVRSAEAAATIDVARLFDDEDYARETAAHLGALERSGRLSEEQLVALAALQATVLTALGEENGREIDRVLAAAPGDPDLLIMAWAAAAGVADPDRMLQSVETAAARVPPEERPKLHDGFDPEMIWPLNQYFAQTDEAKHKRLVEALVAVEWPGPYDRESVDILRADLARYRLDAGDREGAGVLVRSVVSPESWLQFALLRRYDGLVPDADPSRRLEELMDEHDRRTADALARRPDDWILISRRGDLLRAAGRDEDAWALLAPFTADVAATTERHMQGMWLINEAAYALQALGRDDEAVALMKRLVALDMADDSDLIGPSINFSIMLWEAGRYAEALEHARLLQRDFSGYANEYGRMWMASSAACALARLGRIEEARAEIERMKPGEGDNSAALTRALLCVGDMDEAEALMVRRLESDDPYQAVLALQHFADDGERPGERALLVRRLAELRERPAVAAALAKVGRVLHLPVRRTYWGSF